MANIPLAKAVKLGDHSRPPTLSEPPNTPWAAPAKAFRAVRRAAYTPNGIDTIVIHATAGGTSAGAMSVANAGTASWHVLVPAEGERLHGDRSYRCVPDTGAAWHVLSSLKHPLDGGKNINDRSFGIEIVNRQDGKDLFSDWQVEQAAAWVRYWWSNYPIKYLYTHAYLDPGRKSDPGGLFPWTQFMALVAGDGTAALKPHDPPLLVTREGQVVCEGRMIDGALWTPTRKTIEAAGAEIVWHGEQGKAYLVK